MERVRVNWVERKKWFCLLACSPTTYFEPFKKEEEEEEIDLLGD